MRQHSNEWSILTLRSLVFRYKVVHANGYLRCRTKLRARFLAALLGGKVLKRRKTVSAEWVYVKFWGCDVDGLDRLLCDEWVASDSIARQLAFKWELRSKNNQTAWVCGQNYAGKLPRPYSATDVPF